MGVYSFLLSRGRDRELGNMQGMGPQQICEKSMLTHHLN